MHCDGSLRYTMYPVAAFAVKSLSHFTRAEEEKHKTHYGTQNICYAG